MMQSILSALLTVRGGATILAVTAALTLGAVQARAQDTIRPAAIVNDEVISVFDLSQRTRLAILAAGIQPTAEVRARLSSQVLRALIDETLQLQEAERYNIEVEQAEVDDAVSGLAQQNNMNREQFLTLLGQNGVAPDTIEAQFRARIAWTRLMQRQIARRVEVNEAEVDEALARLQANEGKPERRVAEIFLAIDTPSQEEIVRENAERLVQQLSQGASFAGLARQFSQSATAAVGGDLGWVSDGDVSPEVSAVLETMREGEIAGPIRTFGGFHVLLLQGVRLVTLDRGVSDVSLTLKQLFLRVKRNASQSDLRAVEEKVGRVVELAGDCAGMDQAIEKIGDPGSADLGQVSLRDLPGPVANAVSGLANGELSEPVKIGAGISLLMVCGREQASLSASRDAIRDSLRSDQLNVRARRYMRDLRREALVEVRL